MPGWASSHASSLRGSHPGLAAGWKGRQSWNRASAEVRKPTLTSFRPRKASPDPVPGGRAAPDTMGRRIPGSLPEFDGTITSAAPWHCQMTLRGPRMAQAASRRPRDAPPPGPDPEWDGVPFCNADSARPISWRPSRSNPAPRTGGSPTFRSTLIHGHPGPRGLRAPRGHTPGSVPPPSRPARQRPPRPTCQTFGRLRPTLFQACGTVDASNSG